MSNQKFYDIDGQKFDRVTTILGATTSTIGLNRWYADMERKAALACLSWEDTKAVLTGKQYAAELYRDSRADQGTTVHNAIETFLKGQVVAWKDEEKEEQGKFEQFLKWWKDSPMVKIQTERPIHSRTLRVAGTLDLSGELKGRPAIVDFKTGKSIQYDARVQTAAYALLAAEMSGRHPVDYFEHFLTDCQAPNLEWPDCFILHLETDRFDFIPVHEPEIYAQEFLYRLAGFRIREKMAKVK